MNNATCMASAGRYARRVRSWYASRMRDQQLGENSSLQAYTSRRPEADPHHVQVVEAYGDTPRACVITRSSALGISPSAPEEYQ